MKKNLRTISIMIISICTFLGIGKSFAQQASSLTIGDSAPLLKYGKWIKGEPVASLTGDQLYVFEFWATWCVPCIQAMPHLTTLQQEYKGKVNFIGVNIAERVDEGKPYDSSLPSVEKFVKENIANMGFSVIADNNEQFMYYNWLKAAGQNGIPATFIVKNNKILWIGGPGSLDTIIPEILENRYDMEAFKSGFKKVTDLSRKQTADFNVVFGPIEEALKAKEYSKAIELMEKLKTERPDLKSILDRLKFRVLLVNVEEKKAIEFAKEWQKEEKSVPSLLLEEVNKKDGLTKETYLWAAKNFENTGSVTNPVAFDALAGCFAKGGDFKSAVINEEKALELAKKVLKDKSMVGTVMDSTVKEFQEKLKKYQDMIK